MTAAVAFENRPNAIPEFWTCRIVNGPTTWTPSPRRRWPATTCFVTWSATIAASAIAADQLTKHIVTSTLLLDEGTHVLGPLWIHHVQNSGIAFGLFASATSVVILLTGAAVIWMLVYFARSGARHPVLPVALGLVIGGSLSNLLDRVRLGHVTDFLYIRWWPAFNLADSFIVVGVLLILGALVLADRTAARGRTSGADAPAARP